MDLSTKDLEILSRIRKHRLADLSDGMDAIGLVNTGSMDSNMRPIRSGMTMAGFAYTVKLIPSQNKVKECNDVKEYMDELGKWCSDSYAFMDLIRKDKCKEHVIVIDMDGYPGGVWGSEISLQILKHGMVGAIIDGGCRDSHECNLEGVKVWCTKRTFNHVYGRLVNGGIDIPVQCAGVTVCTGDIICADDDGVLVIPRERAEEVLKFAEVIHKSDQEARSRHYCDLGIKPDETLL